MELELVHLSGVLFTGILCHGDKLIVECVMLALCRQSAAEVLDRHCGGAGNEVSEVVGEVGVNGADKQLV